MTSPTTFDIDSKFRKGSKAYQVAQALLSGKEWTRQELEAKFGIKKTNVYRIMQDLREAGVTIETVNGGTGGKNEDGSPKIATHQVTGQGSISVTAKAPTTKATTRPRATAPRKPGVKLAHLHDLKLDFERDAIDLTLEVDGVECAGEVTLDDIDALRRLHRRNEDLTVVSIDLTGEGFKATLIGKGGTLEVSHLTPQTV